MRGMKKKSPPKTQKKIVKAKKKTPTKISLFPAPETSDNIAMIASPTDSFWKWISEFISAEDIQEIKNTDSAKTCLIVHDYGDPQLQKEYFESRIALLACALFEPWVNNNKLWPKVTTTKVLKEYFSFSFIPLVIELEPMNFNDL